MITTYAVVGCEPSAPRICMITSRRKRRIPYAAPRMCMITGSAGGASADAGPQDVHDHGSDGGPDGETAVRMLDSPN